MVSKVYKLGFVEMNAKCKMQNVGDGVPFPALPNTLVRAAVVVSPYKNPSVIFYKNSDL